MNGRKAQRPGVRIMGSPDRNNYQLNGCVMR
jgi:hypothetical protein